MPIAMESVVLLNRDESATETAFGLAVARELRRLHPDNTSGYVAQRLRCTKTAAENLLGGHLSAKSITRLTRAYGLGFMIDVSAAVAGETLEGFIEHRAAEARREAERWAVLEHKEPTIAAKRQSPAQGLLFEPRRFDRERP
jgi:hypothetical protein